MKAKVWVAVIIALVIGALVGWMINNSRQASADKEHELNMSMAKLWEDHITWTRMYLVSAANNLDDTDEVAQRLLRNQEDIGNAIKPYYGDEAGDTLTTLLKEHIMTATEVVAAAQKNDTTALNDANKRWYDNANEIADFLSEANPDNWPRDEMRSMMKEHLDLTGQEAVNILGGNAAAGIADYDKVHEQILEMAHMLAEGIVKQFPAKF